MSGLIDSIKNDVKKAGTNKGKFMYFREGQKQRVRFLIEMDDGIEVRFHDSFEKGVNVPCQEIFGRDCPYCEDEDLRTRSQYVWSVYNYETKEVMLFMFPVNNCSPIPALMAMYENYGTITDRDYVISVTGKQQNKTFSVVPMDKVKFRNEKAKPLSDKAILKMIDKAWPSDVDDDDEDDDEKPVRQSKTKASKGKPSNKKAKAKPEPEDDYDDEQDWDDEDDVLDYSEMSPKELYALCKERKIEAVPKKNAKYYINLLEEWDSAHDDWDDEDEDDDNDDDEWEDDDE